MQQVMARPCRSAAGTLKSGYQSKGALGEELICRTCGIEEEQKNRNGRQAKPDAARDHHLASALNDHGNKIETPHDQKTAATILKLKPLRHKIPNCTRNQNQPLRPSTYVWTKSSSDLVRYVIPSTIPIIDITKASMPQDNSDTRSMMTPSV